MRETHRKQEKHTERERERERKLFLLRDSTTHTRGNTHKMRAALLLLLLFFVAVSVAAAGGKNKKEKNKPSPTGPGCTDWRYGNCVPSNGDCGAGLREGSCDQQTKKMKCKVPCNWKKDFGADCKYRFGSWGECDPGTNLRTRTGTLKRALFNAECQQSITVSKPCPGKTKSKNKGKKRKGSKGN